MKARKNTSPAEEDEATLRYRQPERQEQLSAFGATQNESPALYSVFTSPAAVYLSK